MEVSLDSICGMNVWSRVLQFLTVLIYHIPDYGCGDFQVKLKPQYLMIYQECLILAGWAGGETHGIGRQIKCISVPVKYCFTRIPVNIPEGGSSLFGPCNGHKSDLLIRLLVDSCPQHICDKLSAEADAQEASIPSYTQIPVNIENYSTLINSESPGSPTIYSLLQ